MPRPWVDVVVETSGGGEGGWEDPREAWGYPKWSFDCVRRWFCRDRAGVDSLGGDAIRGWDFDVVDESEGAHDFDDEVGGVELPPVEAVAGGGGEGGVVGGPAFAEAEDAEQGVVSALVVAAEGTCAPEMADGVDAPGDVVDEEDPDEAAPDESEEAAGPGHGGEAADECGDGESEQGPEEEGFADGSADGVGVEILDVLQWVFFVWELAHGVGAEDFLIEEPSHVGVPGSADGSPEGIAVGVGRVGVAVFVADLGVSAVCGDPTEEWSLEGHGSEDGEGCGDDLVGFEASVGEEPVVSDGDAQACEEVHPDEEGEIDPVEGDAPEEDGGGDDAEERDDDDGAIDEFEHPARGRLIDVSVGVWDGGGGVDVGGNIDDVGLWCRGHRHGESLLDSTHAGWNQHPEKNDRHRWATVV